MKPLFTLFTLLLFCSGVALAQNQVEVKYKDLPQDVQKYISKNFEGYAIDKVIQGKDMHSEMTFSDVYVSKGSERMKVTFGRDGKYIKQEQIIAESKQGAPAPATAPPAPGKDAPQADPAIAAPASTPK